MSAEENSEVEKETALKEAESPQALGCLTLEFFQVETPQAIVEDTLKVATKSNPAAALVLDPPTMDLDQFQMALTFLMAHTFLMALEHPAKVARAAKEATDFFST